MRQIAERLGIEINITPEDEVAAQERHERDLSDPLVKRSRDTPCPRMPSCARCPVLEDRGDHDLIAAATRIQETCLTIASKTYRAISGVDDDWSDASDVQSDANGSAKVARLLIDDARRAWRVLMEAGRAAADGVPARLAAVLDELDHDVAARFPNAMEFVRPGFDDAQLHVSGLAPRRSRNHEE